MASRHPLIRARGTGARSMLVAVAVGVAGSTLAGATRGVPNITSEGSRCQ